MPGGAGAVAAMSVLWGIPYLFIKVAVDDGVSPAFLAWSRVVLGGGGAARARAARRAARVAARPGAVAGRLRGLRDRGPVPADRRRRAARRLLRRGDHHRRRAADRRACWRCASTARERVSGRRLVGPADRPRRRRRARRDRHRRRDATSCSARPRSSSPRPATPPGRWCSAATSPTPTRARRWARASRSRPSCSRRSRRRAARPSAVGARRCSSLLVLGLVCTAAAFVIFGRLIAEIGPGRALVITYVNPVVARRARHRRARRAPRRGRDRRPAADPRRLVAVDRRAAPARDRRRDQPRPA